MPTSAHFIPLNKYLLHSANQADDEQPTGRDRMARRLGVGNLGVGNHTFHLLLLLLPS